MICLLINYYWALYLGKKYTYIEINAREWLENLYYLVLSVTGLVGRQQPHLKLTLAGWQHAVEARWEALGEWARHRPPCGWTKLTMGLSVYLSPQGAPTCYLFWISQYKNSRTEAQCFCFYVCFYFPSNSSISVDSCDFSRQNYLLILKGGRKGEETAGHVELGVFLSTVMSQAMTACVLFFRMSVKGKQNRPMGTTDTDSHLASLEIHMVLDKMAKNSEPQFPECKMANLDKWFLSWT